MRGKGRRIREAPFSLCLSLSLKIKERRVHWEILLSNFVPSLKNNQKTTLCDVCVCVNACVCACVYVFHNFILRGVAS